MGTNVGGGGGGSGSGLVYVSGIDPTGVVDATSKIQVALNAGTGRVILPEGLFAITQLTMPNGAWLEGSGMTGAGADSVGTSYSTKLQPLPGTVATSMILMAAGTGTVQLRDLTISGKNGTTQPYSVAVVNFADNVSFANDFSRIERCRIDYAAGSGHNVYYGANRGGIHLENCLLLDAGGDNLHLVGSDGVAIHCDLGYAGRYGAYITGEMSRLVECDLYYNLAGSYVHANRVFLFNCSHDQNYQQGSIVAGAATGVVLHGRFDGNGQQTTDTYPQIDVSAAASGGVTIAPGSQFTNNTFGSWTTTYDVYTGGSVQFADYSNFGATSSVAHTDLPSALQQPSGLAGLGFVTVAAVSAATYSFASTDAGTCKRFTHAGVITATVAVDATYGSAYTANADDIITIDAVGGPVAVVGDGTATVNGSSSATIPALVIGTGQKGQLLRIAASTWELTVTSPPTLVINSQSGATYTFVLNDGDGSVEVQSSSGSATTFTIPPNSSVPYPVGTVLFVRQMGAGALTVAAGSGVTLHGAGTAAAQYTPSLAFTQTAANVWCQN